MGRNDRFHRRGRRWLGLNDPGNADTLSALREPSGGSFPVGVHQVQSLYGTSRDEE